MQRREAIEAIKAVALASGVRIEPEVLRRFGGADALTIHEYATTGGVTLELSDDVYVNAPFDEPFCATSPLRLVGGESLQLVLDEAAVPVARVLPLPGYLDRLDHDGNAVRDVVMSHADRIRLSPISGCAFDCAFCDLATLPYRRRPAERLLHALEVAWDDEQLPPRHLLISGGSPGMATGHQRYFSEVCAAILTHVRSARARRGLDDFHVDIMMSPRPDGPEFVRQMVALGASGFAFNIELYTEEASQRHLPLKHHHARPHLAASIRQAVAELGAGSGRVRSLVVIGLEPPEQTLAAVEWLASMGVDPVLSPFRPADGTALAGHAPPSTALLHEVLKEARAIVRHHGVVLGPRCTPCQHNTLSFPWDVPGEAA